MSHRRRASTTWLPGIAGTGLLGLALGCSSFGSAVGDFDRIAGVPTLAAGAFSEDAARPDPAVADPAVEDPTVLDYPANVLVWEALARAADQDVPDEAKENPTGFARQRLVQMVDRAPGDLGDIGTAAHRLLLVIAADPTPLNHIEAYEGMGVLLNELGVDPIATLDAFRIVRPAGDPLAALRAGAPDARARDAGAASEFIAEYRDALDRVATVPFADEATDRQALRLLVAARDAEPESSLIAPTERALAGVVGLSFTRALILALRSPDPRIADAAAWIVFRRSGVRALPCLLENLTRTVRDRYEYPATARVRRTLLRLVSHASGDVLFERSGRGPRAIDFLYETALRDPDKGVRLIAMETMARCLGRPVSFEASWVEAWWNDFVLHGQR